MEKFVGLSAKLYSHLKDNNDEDKKSKRYKDYKNSLEVAQIENKLNHLEKKNKIDVDSLKEDQKEFIKLKLIN